MGMRSLTLALALATGSVTYAQNDWPTFGHELAGTREAKFVRVWTYQMDGAPPAQAVPAPITFQGKDSKRSFGITATGGGFRGDRSHADTVIAFALP
jgi:hypothetical protein